jgi:hypothetical protein
MRYVLKISLAILLLACLAVSAQAAQFWPLQTGRWMELDKKDQLSNNWTVRIDIFEEVTRDGKQYFRAVEQNYDPPEGDVWSEMYVRSTDTEVYVWNGPGLGETLAFKTGIKGDYWLYEGNTKRKEIVEIESIIIPYGGTYTAYQYKHYRLDNPDHYDLEWVVAGLGWVGEEDYWVSNPLRAPVKAKLARAGMNPFFPFKTGMVMKYNSSDNVGNTWHMRMQVLEQVTLNDKQYYHMRQFNYDPYHQYGGPNTLEDFYIRGDDKALYLYDGNGGENIVFKAADKLTSWSRLESGGTVTTQIVDIVQVTVPYGGPLTAYKHQNIWTNGIDTSPPWYDYVVPGLTMVRIEDNDDNGRTFTHVLASVRMVGGSGAALNLLLIDQ